jgi:hypothetical protein
MAVGKDGFAFGLDAGTPAEQSPSPGGVPRRPSLPELVNGLASRLDVEPERVESMVEELQRPAVIGYPSDYDPAAEALRERYHARGLRYPDARG